MDSLTKLGAKYLHCLIDPWNAEPCHCIGGFPMASNVRTIKNINYGYTVSGFGFAAIKPQYMVTNDVNSVFYSNASTTATAIADSTTTCAYGVSSSPYASTDYTSNGRQVRIVAAGIKVKFCGKNEDIGGSIVGVRSIKGDTLDGLTFSTIDAMENTIKTDFTNQEYAVVFVPNSPLHVQWWDTLSDTENWFQGVSLGIVIQTGQQSTNIPFSIESVVVFECTGNKEKNAMVRKSDSIQYEHVINLCQASVCWVGSPKTFRLNLGDEDDEKTAREFGEDVEQEIPLFYSMSKGDDIEFGNEAGRTTTIIKGDGSNAVMSKGKIARGRFSHPEQDISSVPTMEEALRGSVNKNTKRARSIPNRKRFPGKRKNINHILSDEDGSGYSSIGSNDYQSDASSYSHASSNYDDDGDDDNDEVKPKSRRSNSKGQKKIKFKDAVQSGRDVYELGSDLSHGDLKGAFKDLKDLHKSKLGKMAEKQGLKMLKKKGLPLLKKGGKSLLKHYL